MLSDTSNTENVARRRSRSSTAFSLLGRRHREANHEDESASDDSGLGASAPSRTSITSMPPPLPPTSSASSHPYRHGPSLSTSAANLTQPPSQQRQSSAQQSPSSATPSRSFLADKGPSIEQSVRKFRIVEALRTGDTKTIAKAVRESQPQEAGGPTSAFSSCTLDDTSVLHLAIQCAELPVVEFILSNCPAGATSPAGLDVNARDKDGNTPLHVAAIHGRAPVVRLLLDRPDVNDAIANHHGKLPIDVTRNPEIFQQLQLARSLFTDAKIRQVQELVARGNYNTLKEVLEEPRLKTWMDVNSPEFASDPVTVETGGTLLHEAARRKNSALIQLLLFHGADPFRRDRRGKLPQDVTKDDATRAMLKKSPAAVAAQRGIQEKAVLGHAAAQGAAIASGHPADPVAGKESREMKGYLKKWTNYRRGYQLRWFVLENGVLSYYKHQDDAESVCRGVINMRIARLHMSADDKTKFEIIGNSSVKYSLRANHEVEAKRWIWTLNNSIQWTKDQAREEERHRARSAELLRQAKAEQMSSATSGTNAAAAPTAPAAPAAATSIADTRSERSVNFSVSGTSSSDMRRASASKSSQPIVSPQIRVQPSVGDRDNNSIKDHDYSDGHADDFADAAEHSLRHLHRDGVGSSAIPGEMAVVEDDDDDDDDDHHDHDEGTAAAAASSAASKDALNITAQSARLQLEFMGQVGAALGAELARNPALPLSDTRVAQALSTYDSATRTLRTLVGDLVKIARDRDSHWQHRLTQEVEMRRMWEESMARVALEHDELQARIGEAEMKRKLTRRVLREVIETGATPEGTSAVAENEEPGGEDTKSPAASIVRRRTTLIIDPIQMAGLADPDSNDEDEEFFDAVDAGEVEVTEMPPATTATADAAPSPSVAEVGAFQGPSEAVPSEGIAVVEPQLGSTVVAVKKGGLDISNAFKGYENGIRTKLKIDADNRPKVSLWGILKSMIGKDMTKMTLPVTLNEPTSLLHRCAEDMEYADLLDLAASRADSLERLMYVAAFAASEYASTIGRVAKPFNPLLGETFEYARPDKGYRFFIEQVSHHPPIGAAWAESARWTYYGESAVKSRFYGKSFDINPLGTWFLRLRPEPKVGEQAGGEEVAEQEELYTWKKVTSSVVGIITGKPTVDNYGPMEVRNWTTGEVCMLDFKPRGWTASSAYQLSGKVLDAQGQPHYSIGGHWNSRLYARLLTPGGQDNGTPAEDQVSSGAGVGLGEAGGEEEKALLLWQANERPSGIPFNLTPFAVTFNHLDEQLRPWLAPTDSRLRPDQRAMEEGRYDDAATEKSRLENAQRSRRRARLANGSEFTPAWFARDTCPVTGEAYWRFNGRYWQARERRVWGGLEPIYDDYVAE